MGEIACEIYFWQKWVQRIVIFLFCIA